MIYVDDDWVIKKREKIMTNSCCTVEVNIHVIYMQLLVFADDACANSKVVISNNNSGSIDGWWLLNISRRFIDLFFSVVLIP